MKHPRSQKIDKIVWYLFHRFALTELEFYETNRLILEALQVLESRGEDGIVQARASLYEAYQILQ